MENDNLNFCRIKRNSSVIFAKPIKLRNKDEDISSLDFSKLSRTSDNFHDVFIDDTNKSNGRIFSKWANYGYDVWSVPEDLLPYYLIDNKLGIYDSIVSFKKENGYKYERFEDLKRALFLDLQNNGFSDDVVRVAIYYYFEKNKKIVRERKNRFIQKAYANLDIWNYFVTFTYDDSVLDSEHFYSKLKTFLAKKAYEENWKYMLCYEFSKAGRLHAHGIFSIPEESIRALEIHEEKYYNKKHFKIEIAHISKNLQSRFGRVDFSPVVPSSDEFNDALSYICKYISKQDNKIIFSRGIKTEFLGIIPDFEKRVIGFSSPMSTFCIMDAEDGDIQWLNK